MDMQIPLNQKKSWIDSCEITNNSILDYTDLVDQIINLKKDIIAKHEGYIKHAHINTPRILKELLDILITTKNNIDSAIRENESSHFEHIGGTWRAIYIIISTLIHKTSSAINNLQLRDDNEDIIYKLSRKLSMTSFKYTLPGLIEDFKSLNEVWIHLIKATFYPDTIESSIVEDEMNQRYIAPFWYSFSDELVNFRNGINILKSSVASSYKRSNVVTKTFSLMTGSLTSLLQTSRAQTRHSNDVLKQEANIELIKNMWNLAESGLPSVAISLTKPSIKVAETVTIMLSNEDMAIYNFQSIQCLILSNNNLPFVIPSNGIINSNQTINSDSINNMDIIINFHGGGFVSGSPYTHEMYLRKWVKQSNTLLISVNYTKSPEAFYPIAVNECYYVYKLLVDGFFGFIPKKLLISGDSAGGNLALAVTFKAMSNSIRLPDGMVLAYPAVDLTKTVTPSRILYANDVLLPSYLLSVCLKSYLGDHCDSQNNPLISPLYASDELFNKLPNELYIISSTFDPLLDDTTRFIKRLDKLNKSYKYYLFDMPHGFWNMGAILPSANGIVQHTTDWICNFFST